MSWFASSIAASRQPARVPMRGYVRFAVKPSAQPPPVMMERGLPAAWPRRRESSRGGMAGEMPRVTRSRDQNKS